MIRPISKILIANRGEIAVRIIRTCKRMGLSTVAVYSDADIHSLHVRQADEAIHIGPSPSRESYLHIDKIIKAALDSGADAIHPGYGFLSENDVFASSVEKGGLIFIGPSPHSIRMMGNKLAAKAAAKKFNIPLVPGSDHAISDLSEAKKIATKIGFPLLIKAAAGGGGKGMRIVENAGELDAQMERAMSEALSSFGDGSVFVEKYISTSRHIEIQLMADNYGNTVHLFERECSIQRRHQKIIEEAPSSVLDESKREIMGKDAINVARACNYSGAGTVEFLYDGDGHHYFLEMNTRLQVEHPVTEMITGLDLVEMQIRVAEGHKLPVTQEDLKMNGHAIELRVYAENPLAGFIPSTGKLMTYRVLHDKGIRVDEGFEEGMEIPIHYDPLISKLIVHAPSRNEAIEKMINAIAGYQIRGVETTLHFGKFAMDHALFRAGDFDTHFVEDHIDEFLEVQKKLNAIIADFIAMWYRKRKSILVLPDMEL